jgi:hypothetical protein
VDDGDGAGFGVLLPYSHRLLAAELEDLLSAPLEDLLSVLLEDLPAAQLVVVVLQDWLLLFERGWVRK